MNKNLEIITLIYKSVDYLNFIFKQLKSEFCQVEEWEINVKIVANDATDNVLNRLKELDIDYVIYNDPKPDAYYLSRVYRAWNYSGSLSEYDNICFVNSDMMFSKDWLENLLIHHDGRNIPCSRLVESGKMRSGKHGISYNCGRYPKKYC